MQCKSGIKHLICHLLHWMSSSVMSPFCSTSCSAKIGSQALGAVLWAGGSSWGITPLLANLAVRCRCAGPWDDAKSCWRYVLPKSVCSLHTWLLAHAFIKCYCTEMCLFCCLICWWGFLFALFCSAIYVFLWFARSFLLLLALRLHTTLGSVSISATSWTGTVNLPDLILHLISCAFPLRQSRLCNWEQREGANLDMCRGDLPWKSPPCPPLVLFCWYKCCSCQTEEISREAGCGRGFSQLI